MAAVWIILAKTHFPAEPIESSREKGVRTVSFPFDISADFIPDLLQHPRCGFPLRVLSCIEDPPVVRRILHHLDLWDTQQRPPPGPPQATEFIGGVLPQLAEDPYPYDQSGWASDEPA